MTEQLAEVIKPELNKQTIIRNLHQIADAGVARDVEGLENLINGKGLYENFNAAIEMFGQQQVWFGHFQRGANNIQSRYFAASLSQPPFLDGASYLHAYSMDAGEATFGLLVPFNEQGQLDRNRTISAKWIMDAKVCSIQPSHQLGMDDVPTCEKISWVIQMAAADMAGFIEREWPSTLDEQLAAL